LPELELLSLDSAELLEPTDLSSLTSPVERRSRPVERIDGIYLDSLEPASASQGWGTLQRNKSVWEKPMTIGGRRFVRGLGTHAPSKIVYALDGKYRRFQAWAGADDATSPTVTFEVVADGTKLWESGLVRRGDAAKRVDLDVTGAKTLELIVGDGGNGITSDHADWADARLLR
jgi:alpha-galactosidase